MPRSRLQGRVTARFPLREALRPDAVHDVLYHVVDDRNWRVVLGNLVGHTKQGGSLVLLDQHKDEIQSPASHVRFRTKTLYRDAMADLNVQDVTPPDEEIFLVYRVRGVAA